MKHILVGAISALLLFSEVGPSHADGINKTLINPNPDRTWTKQVGGFFSSAKSYAVLISISNYIGEDKGGYRKLNTRNDAERMANFLLQDMGFDYVRLLTDGEVTKKNLETIMLDEVRTMVRANDRFVFYWSGHGDQLIRSDTNTPFGFLPLQESKLRVYSSMVSMDDIARWNSYLQARHALFILDACLSGLAGVSAKSSPRLEQLSLPARFLLSAGTSTEDALAGDQWGGSLFTDTFIKIAKEKTQSVDGVVSIYRLFDDIQERIAVERQRYRIQKPLTPQLRDLQGGGGAFFFPGRADPTNTQRSQAISDVRQTVDGKGATQSTDAASTSSKETQAMVVGPAPLPIVNDPKPKDLKSVETEKTDPKRREAIDHCSNITSNEGTTFDAGLLPLNPPLNDVAAAPKPPPLTTDEALRIHIGASTHLLSRYAKSTSAVPAKRVVEIPGVLRGSFEVVTSVVPKCNGKVVLTRQTVLKDAVVIAVTYSYSYKTNTLSAEAGRSSLVCSPFDGQFFDIKAAFDGVLDDVQFDAAKFVLSDPAIDFKERRVAALQNSVLGYTMLIEDTGKESKGRKIRQCTETIIHAAAGYQ